MEGLTYIFHLLFIILSLFQVISAEECRRFRRLRNVKVICDNHEFITFNQTVNHEVCVELCDDRKCTAVAMKSAEATRWCCLFTSDNITYHHGNHLLYHSMVITVNRQDIKAPNGNFKI